MTWMSLKLGMDQTGMVVWRDQQPADYALVRFPASTPPEHRIKIIRSKFVHRLRQDRVTAVVLGQPADGALRWPLPDRDPVGGLRPEAGPRGDAAPEPRSEPEGLGELDRQLHAAAQTLGVVYHRVPPGAVEAVLGAASERRLGMEDPAVNWRARTLARVYGPGILGLAPPVVSAIAVGHLYRTPAAGRVDLAAVVGSVASSAPDQLSPVIPPLFQEPPANQETYRR